MKIQVNATMHDGKLSYDIPYLQGLLKKFPDGAQVTITIDEQKQTRSQQQNAYYRGAVVPVVADSIGHSPDETHEALVRVVLGTTEVQVGEQTVETRVSTSTLSKKAFSEYVDAVVDWIETPVNLGGLGIQVPRPQQ